MKTDDWRDNSDITTDYFDISYYIDVKIGTWQKPYKLTQTTQQVNNMDNIFATVSNTELADAVTFFDTEVKRLITISETVEPDDVIISNIQFMVNQIAEEIDTRVNQCG